MYIKNREEYCKIPISALNFSTRTFNCLMRANISILHEAEEGTLSSGVGAILIYPMNAFANDQMKRLRNMLKNLTKGMDC